MGLETLATIATTSKGGPLIAAAVTTLITGGAVAHEVYTGDGNYLATDGYSMQEIETMVDNGSLKCRVADDVKSILGPSFVREIQTELNNEGYSRSGPDDIFGTETCKDVYNLQYDQYHGGNTAFWVDGLVGKQTLGVLRSALDVTEKTTEECKITADVNGDGDTVTDDYADVLAFQKNYNNATGSSIAEDGKRGPKETNGAIKHLQEVVGAGVDCNWGKDSEKLYKAKYVAQTVNASTASPNSSVRAGCEPYHASTQIVLCGSAGQGNEPVELYIRGEDGNMYLQSSAMGRSSRYDNDGSGKEDCITPRNHVKLDKSSMQEESSKGLKYFIPFGDCGGGDGTAFHYYPYLGQNDDSQGCFRTPYDFIKNAYITIQNGGQTEVIVRDK